MEFSLANSRIPPDSIRDTAYVIYLHATITKVRCSEPYCGANALERTFFSHFSEWYVQDLHLPLYDSCCKICNNYQSAAYNNLCKKCTSCMTNNPQKYVLFQICKSHWNICHYIAICKICLLLLTPVKNVLGFYSPFTQILIKYYGHPTKQSDKKPVHSFPFCAIVGQTNGIPRNFLGRRFISVPEYNPCFNFILCWTWESQGGICNHTS